MPPELVVAGDKVLTPEGLRPAAVLIEGGKILDVVERGAVPAGLPGFDAGPLPVLPGLVDAHVHVNEPGRTEWEGFATATRAALSGGVTTLVDMPLNSIPVTTSVQAFEFKWEAAQGQVFNDTAFWGGVVPGNADQLKRMIEDGVCGFKCFLVHSGIDEFPAVTEDDLRKALPVLKEAGVPLLVHAELESEAPACGPSYPEFLASRPPSWELGAIELMIKLCREFKTPVHIVHLSASEALPLIARAKSEGLPLTVETCPHYLTFAAEDVPEGRTDYKCAPPIREAANREALWEGLREGLIDMVVSDHSPCLPQLKLLEEGDFSRAWGGISSVQFGFPAVWTEALKRGIGLEQVARWMSEKPAALAGLSKRKGRIAKGLDADLAVLDVDGEFLVEPKIIKHRHKLTPYLGRRLKGAPAAVFLRGKRVYFDGALDPSPAGELLKHD
jgi:allantoinase